jgi:hypothetical protein
MQYLRELFALTSSMGKLTQVPMLRWWSRSGSYAILGAIAVLQSAALGFELFLGVRAISPGMSLAVLLLNLKRLFAPLLVTTCLLIWVFAVARLLRVLEEEEGLPPINNAMLAQAQFLLMLRQAVLPVAAIAFLAFHPSWFSRSGIAIAPANSIQNVTVQVMQACILVTWGSFAAVVTKRKVSLIGAVLLWTVFPVLTDLVGYLSRNNRHHRFEFLQWDWTFTCLVGWAAALGTLVALKNNRKSATLIGAGFFVLGIAIHNLLPLFTQMIPRISAEVIYSQRDSTWAFAADMASQSSMQFLKPPIYGRLAADGSAWIRGNVPLKWEMRDIAPEWVYATPLLNAAYLLVLWAAMLWLIARLSSEKSATTYNRGHADRPAL